MTPLETLSAHMGNKILGVDTHDIRIRGFVAREDDTEVTGLTVGGDELTDLTDYWPEGTTFAAGELFLFAATTEVTSITIAAGSVTAIRA